MRYLTGLAFFTAGLTLGFILATKRGEEARHIQEQLVATQDRLDATRNKHPSYRRVPLDDLTAIKGIGKVYQRKLRDAGITTYRQLVHTFGQPTLMGDEYKTDAEWCMEIDGQVATIYNYKNGRAYLGAGAPATEEITEWNIGGFNGQALHLVKKAIDSGVRIQE